MSLNFDLPHVVQFPAGLLQSDSAVDKLQEFKMKEDFAENLKTYLRATNLSLIFLCTAIAS